ncbi:hypothetical protein BpHYR1_033451 [Brachionus plicatilis]|uniref:Uncharacterized protein n=1 Tax=Brachionus plicatilis TaxID=10195 RepID=A0A3M7PXM3_BRAPC|nr:hypothetical protein BpHYR1_033451 [Brachionus plicatilis]
MWQSVSNFTFKSDGFVYLVVVLEKNSATQNGKQANVDLLHGKNGKIWLILEKISLYKENCTSVTNNPILVPY